MKKKNSKTSYAMKKVSKKQIQKYLSLQLDFYLESKILKEVAKDKFPYILSAKHVFEDEENMYMATTLCKEDLLTF